MPLFPFWKVKPAPVPESDQELAQPDVEHVVDPPDQPSTALVPTTPPFVAPQLGDRVTDPLTGYTGIVTVIATFLNGCIRIGVQSEKLRDGKVPSEEHFDQGRLRVTQRAVHTPLVANVQEPAPTPEPRRSNGGPYREVPRPNDIVR